MGRDRAGRHLRRRRPAASPRPAGEWPRRLRNCAGPHAVSVSRGLPARPTAASTSFSATRRGRRSRSRPTNGGAFGFQVFAGMSQKEKNAALEGVPCNRARTLKPSSRRSCASVRASTTSSRGGRSTWALGDTTCYQVSPGETGSCFAGGGRARCRPATSRTVWLGTCRAGDTPCFEQAPSPTSVLIKNDRRWVFDMEPRYTISLTITTRSDDHDVRFAGPFSSEKEFLQRSLGSCGRPRRGIRELVDDSGVPDDPRSNLGRRLPKNETEPSL